MTVYLDKSRNRFGRMIMCHMIADTLDELHEMAAALGMKRVWFQSPPKASFPHYDVCLRNRAEALRLGAVELDRSEFVGVMQRIRASLRAAGVLAAAIMVALALASPAAAQDGPEAGLTEGRLQGDPSPHELKLERPQLVVRDRTTPVIVGTSALVAGGLSLLGSWTLYIARTAYRQRAFARLTPDVVDEFTSMGAWGLGLGLAGSALFVAGEALLLPESRDVPTLGWFAGGGGVVLAAVGVGFWVGGEACGPQEYRPGANIRLSCSAASADRMFGPMLLLTSAPLLAVPITYLLRKAFSGAPESLSIGPGSIQMSGRF